MVPTAPRALGRGVSMTLLSLLALPGALASSVNTFGPPKSVNLASAPPVTLYQLAPAGNLEDAHAVVGTPLAAGGWVLAGKAMECGDSCTGGNSASKTEAFAAKLTAAGALAWTWRSNHPGSDDVANGVVELPSGEIIVVGYRTVGGVAKRALTKLSAAGAELWTFTGFGDAASSNGALELVTMDGTTDLLLAGFVQKPTADEMLFKSYGNAPGGKAWVAKLPVSAVAGSSLPGSLAPTWANVYSGYSSAKAAKPMTAAGGGAIVAALWGEDVKAAGLIMLGSDGSTTWGPNDFAAASKLEGTDIAVHGTGASAVIGMSGHGGHLDTGLHYSGKLVLVNANTGVAITTTEITGGGTRELVYNECWGVAAVAGGFVVACGSGIEECNHAGSFQTDCVAGRGVSSTPELLMPAGMWMSMTAMIDTSGTLQWQRGDAYRGDGYPTYVQGQAFTATSSSASEWAMVDASGVVSFVQDETAGFAVMALSTGGSPTTTTSDPTTTTVPNADPTTTTALNADPTTTTAPDGGAPTGNPTTTTSDPTTTTAPNGGGQTGNPTTTTDDTSNGFTAGAQASTSGPAAALTAAAACVMLLLDNRAL